MLRWSFGLNEVLQRNRSDSKNSYVKIGWGYTLKNLKHLNKEFRLYKTVGNERKIFRRGYYTQICVLERWLCRRSPEHTEERLEVAPALPDKRIVAELRQCWTIEDLWSECAPQSTGS